MAWTFTTSGSAIVKAGYGVNTALTASGAIMDRWSDQVENSINAITRKDWVADYASVKANFKFILDDLESDMVAMKLIGYDLSGYSSLAEAQTMLDVLADNIRRNIEILKDDKYKENM